MLINSLFLIDETLDIDTFTKIISSNIKIISTDIISHHALCDLEIEHKVIEDYITSDEELSINNFCQKQATNWHKEKSLESILRYNDFNFGKSIEASIHLYLLESTKLVIGIKNILQTENPSEVHLSSKLLSLVDFIEGINFVEIKNSKKSQMGTEKFPKPIFFGKNINLWIPRGLVLKSVKIIESILTSIFKLKLNFQKPRFEETILLLDLNPRPYQNLLQQLSKFEKNIVLLKDCGTVLWNKTNLDILRNSNSKIIGLNDFGSTKLTSKINKEQKTFSKNFNDSMLGFQPTDFDICGVNMWIPLKKGFLKICSEYFETGILIFELTKIFLEKINVKSMLLLYNTDFIQQIFIYLCQNKNIPCFRLQIGFDPLNQYLAELQPVYLPKHQKIKQFVWGDLVKNYYIKHDVVKNENLFSIGSPRYDELFNFKKPNNISGKILLISSFTYTTHNLSRLDSKRSEHHKEMFEKACKILNNIPSKELIVKLHPGVKIFYPIQPILNKINPSIPVYQSQNITKLLKNCDVLVSMGWSTAMLEAMILQIPVISININSEVYCDDEIIVDGIIKSVNSPEELENAINSILFDSDFRENLIQKGNNFVKKYFTNPGNASKTLSEYLK